MTFMNAGTTTSAQMPGTGFVAHILGAISQTVANFRAARAIDLAAAELHAMNDHMLRDIGVSRSEISHAVRYGR